MEFRVLKKQLQSEVGLLAKHFVIVAAVFRPAHGGVHVHLLSKRIHAPDITEVHLLACISHWAYCSSPLLSNKQADEHRKQVAASGARQPAPPQAGLLPSSLLRKDFNQGLPYAMHGQSHFAQNSDTEAARRVDETSLPRSLVLHGIPHILLPFEVLQPLFLELVQPALVVC